MADPILDNTLALQEMIQMLKSQQAAAPAPPQLTRTFDELTRRMEELSKLYQQGAAPGIIQSSDVRPHSQADDLSATSGHGPRRAPGCRSRSSNRW